MLAALALTLVCAAPAAAANPPGANDWSCKPTSAHPYPVVLVHGTFGDMTVSWNLISPRLKQDGYCVFALDYGNRATAPIEGSAAQLEQFVDRVLAATGAPKVSMVGHSQGGMMPRYYLKFLGGAPKVDDLIGLAPSNHGTTNPGALLLDGVGVCDSCGQQAAGSAFLHEPQRRRRDARQRLLHAGRDPLRRGGHPVHVRLPVRREHHQRAAPVALSAGRVGAPVDHLRRRRAALDPQRTRAPGSGGPGYRQLPAALGRTRGAARLRLAFPPMDGDGPRFGAMIALVAIVVATVILVFFGIGYALGRLFL